MKNGAKAIGELTSSPSPRLVTARIRADKDTVSIQKLFIFLGGDNFGKPVTSLDH